MSRLKEIQARRGNDKCVAHTDCYKADIEYLLARLAVAETKLANVADVAEWVRDNHGDYVSREIEDRIRAALSGEGK